MIRTVELFAGVGGFRLGLERASSDYKTIWANQWEPSMKMQYAFDCYVSHFGNDKYCICKDIAEVKNTIPAHDLLVGGFPCQDYSIMKKGSLGIEGPKGILWWQINDIIKSKKPKFILLENVDRLVWSPSKQNGRDFSIILRCLYENGYAAEWRIINAADYGQPQRRRRTFIFAYHKTTDYYRNFAEQVCINGLKQMHKCLTEYGVLAKAFPVTNHSNQFVDNWIDELKYAEIADLSANQIVHLHNSGAMMNGRIYSVELYPSRKSSVFLKDILETSNVDSRYYLKENDMEKWVYEKGAKNEIRKHPNGKPYTFKEGKIQFPDSLNKPSRTILTSESELGRATHVVTDLETGKLRVLTPIECERLNGFPDKWTNTGMPERMRYFCMGNALVVPLVTMIGKQIEEIV